MADILLDTGFLYALADQDDDHHSRSKAVLAQVTKEDSLVLPNFLLAETHTVINKRLGPQAAKAFLNAAIQDYHVERVTSEDEMAAHALLQEVSRSRDFSYFDAAACAVALRLGIERVFTFDRHFQQLGFEILKR